jgi:hypothetical protein
MASGKSFVERRCETDLSEVVALIDAAEESVKLAA